MVALTKQKQEFRLKTIEPVVIKLPKAVKVDDVEFVLEHKQFDSLEHVKLDVLLFNDLNETVGKAVKLSDTGRTKFDLTDSLKQNGEHYNFLKIKSHTDLIILLTMVEIDKPEFF